MLHREVDIFINEKKTQINSMKNQDLALLDKQKDEVLSLISEIEQRLKHITEMLDTNDFFIKYLRTNRILHSDNRPLKFIFPYQTFPPKKLSAKRSVKCSVFVAFIFLNRRM